MKISTIAQANIAQANPSQIHSQRPSPLIRLGSPSQPIRAVSAGVNCTAARPFKLPLLALLLSCSLLAACSAPSLPRRNPVGEFFPVVEAEFLTGDAIELPTELAGQPAILLVGFEMETQFDLDRWILGLVQLESKARILEVPTIPGLVPGLISNTIDQGMRNGIPSEDWLAVATVYGQDAKSIAELTGNESARNGRILLLDSTGRITWFHDRGYSAGKLMQLHAAWSELASVTE